MTDPMPYVIFTVTILFTCVVVWDYLKACRRYKNSIADLKRIDARIAELEAELEALFWQQVRDEVSPTFPDNNTIEEH